MSANLKLVFQKNSFLNLNLPDFSRLDLCWVYLSSLPLFFIWLDSLKGQTLLPSCLCHSRNCQPSPAKAKINKQLFAVSSSTNSNFNFSFLLSASISASAPIRFCFWFRFRFQFRLLSLSLLSCLADWLTLVRPQPWSATFGFSFNSRSSFRLSFVLLVNFRLFLLPDWIDFGASQVFILLLSAQARSNSRQTFLSFSSTFVALRTLERGRKWLLAASCRVALFLFLFFSLSLF